MKMTDCPNLTDGELIREIEERMTQERNLRVVAEIAILIEETMNRNMALPPSMSAL